MYALNMSCACHNHKNGSVLVIVQIISILHARSMIEDNKTYCGVSLLVMACNGTLACSQTAQIVNALHQHCNSIILLSLVYTVNSNRQKLIPKVYVLGLFFSRGKDPYYWITLIGCWAWLHVNLSSDPPTKGAHLACSILAYIPRSTAMGATASTRRKKKIKVPSGAYPECDEDAISTSSSGSESSGEWDTLPPFPTDHNKSK